RPSPRQWLSPSGLATEHLIPRIPRFRCSEPRAGARCSGFARSALVAALDRSLDQLALILAQHGARPDTGQDPRLADRRLDGADRLDLPRDVVLARRGVLQRLVQPVPLRLELALGQLDLGLGLRAQPHELLALPRIERDAPDRRDR